MTAEELENAINTHVRQGWTMDCIVAGETDRFMGLSDKDVFFLIFRKSVDAAKLKPAAAEPKPKPDAENDADSSSDYVIE